MKFPRNARIIRSQLDAAPFAGVLFCLLIFVLLCSLVYTPGVLIKLPVSTNPLPGVEGPKIYVALAANGNFIYQNQIIQESDLVKLLKAEVARHSNPLTLVVAADSGVTRQQEAHVEDIAASAGIHLLQEQTLPRLFDESEKVRKKP